jgi:hypothetical protein
MATLKKRYIASRRERSTMVPFAQIVPSLSRLIYFSLMEPEPFFLLLPCHPQFNCVVGDHDRRGQTHFSTWHGLHNLERASGTCLNLRNRKWKHPPEFWNPKSGAITPENLTADVFNS